MRKKQEKYRFLLAILLCVLLCAQFWGCGEKDEDTPPGEEEGTKTETVSDPPEDGAGKGGKKEEAGENGGDKPVQVVLTLADAVGYIRTLTPGELGLSGDSMANYEIYAAEEMVPVDGMSCAKLSVYRRSEASGTNTIEGVYLLARDGSCLYRLNPEDGAVEELARPAKSPLP